MFLSSGNCWTLHPWKDPPPVRQDKVPGSLRAHPGSVPVSAQVNDLQPPVMADSGVSLTSLPFISFCQKQDRFGLLQKSLPPGGREEHVLHVLQHGRHLFPAQGHRRLPLHHLCFPGDVWGAWSRPPGWARVEPTDQQRRVSGDTTSQDYTMHNIKAHHQILIFCTTLQNDSPRVCVKGDWLMTAGVRKRSRVI